MKVAIFGGTGFVGSYIIDELIKNKHKPIVLVRSGSEHKLIQKDKVRNAFIFEDDFKFKFFSNSLSFS